MLTASAWLSPSAGGSGRSNGNTQVGAAPSVTLGSAAGGPLAALGHVLRAGTSTRASTGWSAVGSGPASAGQIVAAAPRAPSSSRCCWTRARRRAPCRPPTPARAGSGRRPATRPSRARRPARRRADSASAAPDRPSLGAPPDPDGGAPDQPEQRRSRCPAAGRRARRSPSSRARTSSTSPSPKPRRQPGGLLLQPTPRRSRAAGAAPAPSAAARTPSAGRRRAPRR